MLILVGGLHFKTDNFYQDSETGIFRTIATTFNESDATNKTHWYIGNSALRKDFGNNFLQLTTKRGRNQVRWVRRAE
ncbi:hypothetical protein M8C21_031131 [Ambrosia artemisiifolia]|uniref:Uncharacterized protein n=1 Tax=Ambrosia artemisiifolia TaxID=4212 RepID=A0AAD5GRW1_AMBAR|nr:hypothetical protein M8C21_031131 [Ambrosia artemisiifolia]